MGKNKKKYAVNVAWSHEATDYAFENGWAGLLANGERLGLMFDTVEFDSEAERNAYVKGINDANGWDDPITHIVQ